MRGSTLLTSLAAWTWVVSSMLGSCHAPASAQPAPPDSSPLGAIVSQSENSPGEADGLASSEFDELPPPSGEGLEIGVDSQEEVDLPGVLSEAVEAYRAGSYSSAVASFERLLEIGPDNASAHYNLGNALLRNGELGRAIAAYRRARARAPRDEDIAANLEFARTSARDALVVPDPGPVARTLAFWHYGFSRAERWWLAVVCNVLFFSGLAVMLARRRSVFGSWLTAISGLVLLAILGSLAAESWQADQVAVVVPAEVEAFSAPDSAGTVRFKLHAGSEVRVRERRTDWVLIALPDGERGWLERQHLELVS